MTEIIEVKDIIVDEKGMLKPQTGKGYYLFADQLLKSGMLPKGYDTPSKVVIGMQYAISLGLDPLVSLRQIAVVNGTPSVFGDLPLSMVYASGKLEWIKEFHYDKEGKKICVVNNNLEQDPIGHVTVVKRHGDPEEYESIFTMKDAESAGLITRSDVWKKYPKRMLKYRSRSQALKDKFPDCLNGIAIKEYDIDGVEKEERIQGRSSDVEVKSKNSMSPLNEMVLGRDEC